MRDIVKNKGVSLKEVNQQWIRNKTKNTQFHFFGSFISTLLISFCSTSNVKGFVTYPTHPASSHWIRTFSIVCAEQIKKPYFGTLTPASLSCFKTSNAVHSNN